MSHRQARLRAVAWAALFLTLAPAMVRAQRIGVFFDLAGSLCTTTIEPFGAAVHAWVLVYPDSVQMGGANFAVELPPGLAIKGNPVFAHGSIFTHEGDIVHGVSVQFYPLPPESLQVCRTGRRPYKIVEFDLEDRGDAPRSDLVVHLRKAEQDSFTGVKPRIKICDPNDPQGNLGLVEARSIDAIFNCTRACHCTTAIVRSTWSLVKSLFRER